MSNLIPVSAIVMTKNEANNIVKCLASLAGVTEIFVVDSGSTDGTQQLAEKSGATVVQFEWNGKYPKKKQWSLENLPFSYDWVLYVDADEEVTPELSSELEELLRTGPKHTGYFVEYDYLFMGKLLVYGQKVMKIVLFDRREGFFADQSDLEATNSGEVEPHFQPTINGSVGKLNSKMLHADHDNLYHYFDRHNRYSDWEAVVRLRGAIAQGSGSEWGFRGRLKKAFDRLPLKGPLYFVYSYFFRLGFLDGRAGLQYAVAKGFYYWQVEMKITERLRANETVDQ